MKNRTLCCPPIMSIDLYRMEDVMHLIKALEDHFSIYEAEDCELKDLLTGIKNKFKDYLEHY